MGGYWYIYTHDWWWRSGTKRAVSRKSTPDLENCLLNPISRLNENLDVALYANPTWCCRFSLQTLNKPRRYYAIKSENSLSFCTTCKSSLFNFFPMLEDNSFFGTFNPHCFRLFCFPLDSFCWALIMAQALNPEQSISRDDYQGFE